jgi:hypothetical protein
MSHSEKGTTMTTQGPELGDHPPYQEIMDGYNGSIGIMRPDDRPRVMKLTTARREQIVTRWKERAFRERWREVFNRAARIGFMCGRANGEGHKNFRADFDWLLKNDTNYLKILEGKYKEDRPISALPSSSSMTNSDMARAAIARRREQDIKVGAETDDTIRRIHAKAAKLYGALKVGEGRYTYAAYAELLAEVVKEKQAEGHMPEVKQ